MWRQRPREYGVVGALAQLALPNCQNRGSDSRIASGCIGGKVTRFRIARSPKHTIKALVSVNGARLGEPTGRAQPKPKYKSSDTYVH